MFVLMLLKCRSPNDDEDVVVKKEDDLCDSIVSLFFMFLCI